ncbi:MAG TPA: response regulator [Anaerolineae bacterium]|nr:response regulator [Anaerolineae bacterium]
MRVLIADDESIIRMGLKSMLRELGHEATAARNGREALEMARRSRFDLAILDIRMPYTDGLQVAKVLGKSQPMPILLLTAHSDGETIERAAALPIQGYLVKPIQAGELAAAIAVAVKQFEQTQALVARAGALEEKLVGQKLIARAKAKLMAGGMSEEMAYESMQKVARERQLSMGEIAAVILRDSGE